MKEKLLMPLAAIILVAGLASFSGCSGDPAVDPDANKVGEEENLNEDPGDTGEGKTAGTDGKGEKQFTSKKKKDTGDDDTGDDDK